MDVSHQLQCLIFVGRLNSDMKLPCSSAAFRAFHQEHHPQNPRISKYHPTFNRMILSYPMDPFGSAALNALRVQFGGNLYLLRRYDWIHRVRLDPCMVKSVKSILFWECGKGKVKLRSQWIS